MRTRSICLILGAASVVSCSSQEVVPEPRSELEPLVRIGLVDGPDEYLFDQVLDVSVTTAGEMVVTDRSGRIRVFDAAGNFQRVLGRKGRGPGEYLEPFVVEILGESGLRIYDRQLRKLSIHSPDGAHISSRVVNASGTPVGASHEFYGWKASASLVRALRLWNTARWTSRRET